MSSRTRRAVLVALISLLPATAFVVAPSRAADDDIRNESAQAQAYRQLQDQLRDAEPMPFPEGRIFTQSQSQSAAHRESVSVDLETGEVRTAPAGPAALDQNPRVAPPQLGSAGERDTAAMPFEGEDGSRLGALATRPTPLADTTPFPARAVHKLLISFERNGQVARYVCSAAAVGRFHLLTAGHCIHRQDSGFAFEIQAFPGQTDRVDWIGDADHPFGSARGVYMRTYTGWTQYEDLNHDWAIVTLDRPAGNHTGWYGVETNTSAASLNYSGYPAETPHVPAGTHFQYPGFEQVTGYSSGRISMDAYTYGGHSGGPVWRYDGTNRYVQGLNSTSNRAGSATATRITNGKFDDMFAWMREDESARPPANWADLIEYTYETGRKGLLTSSAAPGDSVTLDYNVFNAGHAPAADVTLHFVLSPDRTISSEDYRFGQLSLGALSPFNYLASRASFPVPAGQAAGVYYVGWYASTATGEYELSLNAALASSSQLAVLPGCDPDGFEPDGSSGAAPLIQPGPTSHSLCPAGDEDWARFELAEDSAVIVTTGGQSGDTVLTLYDATLAPIASDDDGGLDRFSRIERTCADPLPAGSYFLQVTEFGGDGTVDAYDLTLATQPCEEPPPPAQLVSGTRIRLRDVAGRPEGRRMKLELRDGAIQPSGRGSSGDPRDRGASLVLRNPDSGEEVVVSLPPSGWTPRKRGYSFRSRSGPCTSASIEAGRITALCGGAGLDFDLDEERQGRLAVLAILGDEVPYCTVFGGELRKDWGIGHGRNRRYGEFDAYGAPRPESCPF